jgi:hypothetical protein
MLMLLGLEFDLVFFSYSADASSCPRIHSLFAQVLIRTPLYEAYGPLVSRTSEFYVMGTCEYEGGTISGVAGGEEGESRALTLGEQTRRDLYTLPRWVAPLNGCQKDVDFFYGNAKQIEGGAGGVESEGGRRRSLASGKAIVRAAQAKRGLATSNKSPRLNVDRKLLNFYKNKGSTGHLPDQIRRSVTNFWHGANYDKRRMLKREALGLPVRHRDLGAQSMVQPEVGILAMGVERHQFDRTKVEKHMPATWLNVRTWSLCSTGA